MHQAWVRGFASALAGDDLRAYVNFLVDEGPERVRQAYPGADVGSPPLDQGALRPVQPVPSQPEHPAGHGGRGLRFTAEVRREDGHDNLGRGAT